MSRRNKSPARQPSNSVKKQNSTVKQTVQVAHSGPLPDPITLQQYKQISPDLVDRIVSMAEAESSSRRQLEARQLDANIQIANKNLEERKLGQIFGLTIGSLGLVSAVILGSLGLEDAASIVGGSTVVGLVGIFVTGQIINKGKDKK